MTMPTYEIFIDGKSHKVEIMRTAEKLFTIKVDGKPASLEVLVSKPDLEKPFSIKIDDRDYQVAFSEIDLGKPFQVKVEEISFKAELKTTAAKPSPTTFAPTIKTPATTRKSVSQREIIEGAVTAPMTGRITSIKVKEGDTVKQGQVLCIIEAMKMENEITAPKAGTVQEISVQEGSSVSEGEPLLTIN